MKKYLGLETGSRGEVEGFKVFESELSLKEFIEEFVEKEKMDWVEVGMEEGGDFDDLEGYVDEMFLFVEEKKGRFDVVFGEERGFYILDIEDEGLKELGYSEGTDWDSLENDEIEKIVDLFY